MGITAFSKPEGFNSVINSLMPMAAGAGVAARKIDIEGAIKKVSGFVKKIISKMRKKVG
jgi:hypothetical protein